MSIDLNDLINDTREISIPVGGKALTVTYRPNALTPRFRAEMEAFRQEAGDDEYVAEWLSRVIKSWNLKKSGKPVPIAEGLPDLPDRLRRQLIDAVVEDAVPNEDSAASSNGT